MVRMTMHRLLPCAQEHRGLQCMPALLQSDECPHAQPPYSMHFAGYCCP